MHLEWLELQDFRSYVAAKIRFGPGVHVLVGPNAQGKTNLVEAVHYLAVGSSHRASSDTQLVRAGRETAVIRAGARISTAAREGRPLTVEWEIRAGGRNRARVDGQQLPRQADALGRIRSVLFAPEDLQLVRGDPGARRRFLDDLLTQRRPAYGAARADYERVLRQRNTLLRQARVRGGRPGESLGSWTDALVNAAAGLLAARIAAVHALAGPAAEAYADLVTGSAGPAGARRPRLVYELSTGRHVDAAPGDGVPDPAELAAELAAGLWERATAEVERGMTLAGPHRDELGLWLGDLPAKGYASHGEAWSLALALRLASRDVLGEVGEEPVVLLDDVFAELDADRRGRLAARCKAFEQVLVTAAVDEDVPLAGTRHSVRDGAVTHIPEPGP